MVPKREKGQAANRRLTRYIMLASIFHLSSYMYITSKQYTYMYIASRYHAMDTVHVNAGAIRKLMCG